MSNRVVMSDWQTKDQIGSGSRAEAMKSVITASKSTADKKQQKIELIENDHMTPEQSPAKVRMGILDNKSTALQMVNSENRNIGILL